jgi:hypothetical protein
VKPILNIVIPILSVGLALASHCAAASQNIEERLRNLETSFQILQTQVNTIQAERDSALERASSAERRLEEYRAVAGPNNRPGSASVEEINLASSDSFLGSPTPPADWRSLLPQGLRIGAYGEHHFNWVETDQGSQSDIHRFVLFLGYDFNEWLHLVTETEIEHAFVEGGDGELILEQFYVDMNFTPALNLRLGRALHPAGIINRHHEPTSFYSVERPTFSTLILPSTWSIDGAGLWGDLTDWLSYEAYLHAGLKGTGFSASSGIRNGRLKERPGLGSVGFSGRMDFDPLEAFGADTPVEWRLGGSYSAVGTGNANRGTDNSEFDGLVHIGAFDTQARWDRFEFRSEFAFLRNNIADDLLNGTGYNQYGWYVEGAVHLLPQSWKTGRLAESDLVAFLRYEKLTLQDDLPSPLQSADRFNLDEITFGLAFYPTPHLVLKADYTFADTEDGNADNRLNLGLGYDF